MKVLFERSARFLELPLGLRPRGLLLLATLLLAPAIFAPLWKLTMYAPQHPEGLSMEIYSYKLEGAHGGRDVEEINLLNRDIGMRNLAADDFAEFRWIPFVLGALALLFLRTALLGKLGTLVDTFVLYAYFGLFSLWSFGYKLYTYGHDLAPTASVRVAPFMPPLFGHKKLAHLDVDAYPAAGSYALAALGVVLAAAVLLAWREGRASEATDARAAG